MGGSFSTAQSAVIDEVCRQMYDSSIPLHDTDAIDLFTSKISDTLRYTFNYKEDHKKFQAFAEDLIKVTPTSFPQVKKSFSNNLIHVAGVKSYWKVIRALFRLMTPPSTENKNALVTSSDQILTPQKAYQPSASSTPMWSTNVTLHRPLTASPDDTLDFLTSIPMSELSEDHVITLYLLLPYIPHTVNARYFVQLFDNIVGKVGDISPFYVDMCSVFFNFINIGLFNQTNKIRPSQYPSYLHSVASEFPLPTTPHPAFTQKLSARAEFYNHSTITPALPTHLFIPFNLEFRQFMFQRSLTTPLDTINASPFHYAFHPFFQRRDTLPFREFVKLLHFQYAHPVINYLTFKAFTYLNDGSLFRQEYYLRRCWRMQFIDHDHLFHLVDWMRPLVHAPLSSNQKNLNNRGVLEFDDNLERYSKQKVMELINLTLLNNKVNSNHGVNLFDVNSINTTAIDTTDANLIKFSDITTPHQSITQYRFDDTIFHLILSNINQINLDSNDTLPIHQELLANFRQDAVHDTNPQHIRLFTTPLHNKNIHPHSLPYAAISAPTLYHKFQLYMYHNHPFMNRYYYNFSWDTFDNPTISTTQHMTAGIIKNTIVFDAELKFYGDAELRRLNSSTYRFWQYHDKFSISDFLNHISSEFLTTYSDYLRHKHRVLRFSYRPNTTTILRADGTLCDAIVVDNPLLPHTTPLSTLILSPLFSPKLLHFMMEHLADIWFSLSYRYDPTELEKLQASLAILDESSTYTNNFANDERWNDPIEWQVSQYALLYHRVKAPSLVKMGRDGETPDRFGIPYGRHGYKDNIELDLSEAPEHVLPWDAIFPDKSFYDPYASNFILDDYNKNHYQTITVHAMQEMKGRNYFIYPKNNTGEVSSAYRKFTPYLNKNHFMNYIQQFVYASMSIHHNTFISHPTLCPFYLAPSTTNIMYNTCITHDCLKNSILSSSHAQYGELVEQLSNFLTYLKEDSLFALMTNATPLQPYQSLQTPQHTIPQKMLFNLFSSTPAEKISINYIKDVIHYVFLALSSPYSALGVYHEQTYAIQGVDGKNMQKSSDLEYEKEVTSKRSQWIFTQHQMEKWSSTEISHLQTVYTDGLRAGFSLDKETNYNAYLSSVVLPCLAYVKNYTSPGPLALIYYMKLMSSYITPSESKNIHIYSTTIEDFDKDVPILSSPSMSTTSLSTSTSTSTSSSRTPSTPSQADRELMRIAYQSRNKIPFHHNEVTNFMQIFTMLSQLSSSPQIFSYNILSHLSPEYLSRLLDHMTAHPENYATTTFKHSNTLDTSFREIYHYITNHISNFSSDSTNNMATLHAIMAQYIYGIPTPTLLNAYQSDKLQVVAPYPARSDLTDLETPEDPTNQVGYQDQCLNALQSTADSLLRHHSSDICTTDFVDPGNNHFITSLPAYQHYHSLSPTTFILKEMLSTIHTNELNALTPITIEKNCRYRIDPWHPLVMSSVLDADLKQGPQMELRSYHINSLPPTDGFEYTLLNTARNVKSAYPHSVYDNYSDLDVRKEGGPPKNPLVFRGACGIWSMINVAQPSISTTLPTPFRFDPRAILGRESFNKTDTTCYTFQSIPIHEFLELYYQYNLRLHRFPHHYLRVWSNTTTQYLQNGYYETVLLDHAHGIVQRLFNQAKATAISTPRNTVYSPSTPDSSKQTRQQIAFLNVLLVMANSLPNRLKLTHLLTSFGLNNIYQSLALEIIHDPSLYATLAEQLKSLETVQEPPDPWVIPADDKDLVHKYVVHCVQETLYSAVNVRYTAHANPFTTHLPKNLHLAAYPYPTQEQLQKDENIQYHRQEFTESGYSWNILRNIKAGNIQFPHVSTDDMLILGSTQFYDDILAKIWDEQENQDMGLSPQVPSRLKRVEIPPPDVTTTTTTQRTGDRASLLTDIQMKNHKLAQQTSNNVHQPQKSGASHVSDDDCSCSCDDISDHSSSSFTDSETKCTQHNVLPNIQLSPVGSYNPQPASDIVTLLSLGTSSPEKSPYYSALHLWRQQTGLHEVTTQKNAEEKRLKQFNFQPVLLSDFTVSETEFGAPDQTAESFITNNTVNHMDVLLLNTDDLQKSLTLFNNKLYQPLLLKDFLNTSLNYYLLQPLYNYTILSALHTVFHHFNKFFLYLISSGSFWLHISPNLHYHVDYNIKRDWCYPYDGKKNPTAVFKHVSHIKPSDSYGITDPLDTVDTTLTSRLLYKSKGVDMTLLLSTLLGFVDRFNWQYQHNISPMVEHAVKWNDFADHRTDFDKVHRNFMSLTKKFSQSIYHYIFRTDEVTYRTLKNSVLNSNHTQHTYTLYSSIRLTMPTFAPTLISAFFNIADNFIQRLRTFSDPCHLYLQCLYENDRLKKDEETRSLEKFQLIPVEQTIPIFPYLPVLHENDLVEYYITWFCYNMFVFNDDYWIPTRRVVYGGNFGHDKDASHTFSRRERRSSDPNEDGYLFNTDPQFKPLILNLLAFCSDTTSPAYTHNLVCLSYIYHHFSHGLYTLDKCDSAHARLHDDPPTAAGQPLPPVSTIKIPPNSHRHKYVSPIVFPPSLYKDKQLDEIDSITPTERLKLIPFNPHFLTALLNANDLTRTAYRYKYHNVGLNRFVLNSIDFQRTKQQNCIRWVLNYNKVIQCSARNNPNFPVTHNYFHWPSNNDCLNIIDSTILYQFHKKLFLSHISQRTVTTTAMNAITPNTNVLQVEYAKYDDYLDENGIYIDPRAKSPSDYVHHDELVFNPMDHWYYYYSQSVPLNNGSQQLNDFQRRRMIRNRTMATSTYNYSPIIQNSPGRGFAQIAQHSLPQHGLLSFFIQYINTHHLTAISSQSRDTVETLLRGLTVDLKPTDVIAPSYLSLDDFVEAGDNDYNPDTQIGPQTRNVNRLKPNQNYIIVNSLGPGALCPIPSLMFDKLLKVYENDLFKFEYRLHFEKHLKNPPTRDPITLDTVLIIDYPDFLDVLYCPDQVESILSTTMSQTNHANQYTKSDKCTMLYESTHDFSISVEYFCSHIAQDDNSDFESRDPPNLTSSELTVVPVLQPLRSAFEPLFWKADNIIFSESVQNQTQKEFCENNLSEFILAAHPTRNPALELPPYLYFILIEAILRRTDPMILTMMTNVLGIDNLTYYSSLTSNLGLVINNSNILKLLPFPKYIKIAQIEDYTQDYVDMVQSYLKSE